MRKEEIKTIKDLDTYRYERRENGIVQSRYRTLVQLYGQQIADKMMRELEVKSWYPRYHRVRE